MHSNNDILDVVDAQSSAGVLGSRDNPPNADGPRNALHQQWNRDSLLGRSYRDVREVVAANTLPNYAALTSIPSSNSRDNTLSREIHHFTVGVKYIIQISMTYSRTVIIFHALKYYLFVFMINDNSLIALHRTVIWVYVRHARLKILCDPQALLEQMEVT